MSTTTLNVLQCLDNADNAGCSKLKFLTTRESNTHHAAGESIGSTDEGSGLTLFIVLFSLCTFVAMAPPGCPCAAFVAVTSLLVSILTCYSGMYLETPPCTTMSLRASYVDQYPHNKLAQSFFPLS